MCLRVIFWILINLLSVCFFGRFFGFYTAAILKTSCVILAVLVSIFIFYEVFSLRLAYIFETIIYEYNK